MPHHFRSLLLIALIMALPLPVGVQAAPSLEVGVQSASPLGVGVQPGPAGPGVPDAAAWYDGLIQYSTITNCVSIIQGLPYQENGAGTYVGFLADPDAGQPAPNTTYYVHVCHRGIGKFVQRHAGLPGHRLAGKHVAGDRPEPSCLLPL